MSAPQGNDQKAAFGGRSERNKGSSWLLSSQEEPSTLVRDGPAPAGVGVRARAGGRGRQLSGLVVPTPGMPNLVAGR